MERCSRENERLVYIVLQNMNFENLGKKSADLRSIELAEKHNIFDNSFKDFNQIYEINFRDPTRENESLLLTSVCCYVCDDLEESNDIRSIDAYC